MVHLGLPKLKYRILHGDKIEVFEIIKHKYDYKLAPELICNTRNTFCGTWYLPHSHVHN